MCNRVSVFSVAVKKARFVCEDGSYMERMGNTMEVLLIRSIDLFSNYSFLITELIRAKY